MAGSDLTYQGKPCIHGHSGLRWKRDNKCVECVRLRDQLRSKSRDLFDISKGAVAQVIQGKTWD